MPNHDTSIRYPRRGFIRGILRAVIHVLLALLTDLHIEGLENLPKSGPVLIVGNHFSYIDPVAIIRAVPGPIEFLGGFRNPGATPLAAALPGLWGYYPVFRGTASRRALRAGEAVLAQGGSLVVMPEGGSWATVLRPARPGAAFLAARTGARIVPVGLDGLTDVFPALREGRRARVTIRIGEPFGPFEVTGHGRERRAQLDAIGHEIMRHIAPLIPPERRGYYSANPAIREAAWGTEVYPWDSATETEFKAGEHL
jgi:1-acyl-sn-glycerol-3-phosphate acyltransferase